MLRNLKLKINNYYIIIIILISANTFAMQIPADTSKNTWYGQGSHFRKHIEFEKKINNYKQDLKTNPKDCITLSNIGYLFLENFQPDSAIIYYKQYKSVCNDSFYANLYLGWAFFELDSVKTAFQYFERVKNIDRDEGIEAVLEYLDRRYNYNLDNVPLNVLLLTYKFYPKNYAITAALASRYKEQHKWTKYLYYWFKKKYLQIFTK